MAMEGNQIVRVVGKDDLKIDCYLANNKNFEVLKLIRTGSKEHNIKLTTEALKQGKQLKFSEGLIDKKTKKLIANTEEGVFKELGMEFKQPKDRN